MRIHNDSWSLVTQKKYAEVLEKIGDENGFLWELQNWEALSETIQPDKKSYARYYQNELKRELEEMENGKQGAGIDRKNYR